jgi:small conductance mechanosensitive channel
MKDFWTMIAAFLRSFGTSVLEAIALLLAGVVVIKLISRGLRAILKRTKVEGAAGSFLISIAQAALALLLFFIIMDIFDINTSSIVTMLAASGLAIGLALQDGLSNFASGITMLATRPFKENDHVKINDVEGKIKKIRLTTTELLTFDNVSILIPNKLVTASEIINYTNRPTRRVDITVSASYESDVDMVKTALNQLVEEENRILTTPAPDVLITALGAYAVDYRVRMWTTAENYWDVRNGFHEKILRRFKEKGIEIPYQKINIFVKREEGNG